MSGKKFKRGKRKSRKGARAGKGRAPGREAQRALSSGAVYDAPEDEEAMERVAEQRLAGCSVLVVDDDGVYRSLICEYVRRAGARVSFAEHGRRGLDNLEQNLPDAVVTDIRMPVLDGLGMLRLIKSHDAFKGLPVIAISGEEPAQGRDGMIAAGFAEFIPKPVDPKTLIDAIVRSLNGHFPGGHGPAAGH